ncbi:MAG: CBS domain-containing protein [Candidatus Scalinduaceae bacterium]
MRKQIELIRVFSIPIKLDLSWFIIVAFISWTLASGYFPIKYPELDKSVCWIMGFISAVLLFVCVLLHELSHSLIAKKNNIPIKGITLFVFGGVAEMTEEPRTASSEIKMAVAGPICSGALAIFFFFIGNFFIKYLPILPVIGILKYCTFINLALMIFNLLPGFPLDGGRILRAVIWNYTGNIKKATYTTSKIGSSLGIFLIIFGFFNIFTGNIIGGLWFAFIGLFLKGAAEAGYQQLLAGKLLHGIKISEIMTRDVITIEDSITLDKLVDDYFLKYRYNSYPVVSNGILIGMVSIHDVKQIPREEWSKANVRRIFDSKVIDLCMNPNDDATSAMAKMAKRGLGRIPVVDNGKLVGIVSHRDIMQIIKHKIDLSM